MSTMMEYSNGNEANWATAKARAGVWGFVIRCEGLDALHLQSSLAPRLIILGAEFA